MGDDGKNGTGEPAGTPAKQAELGFENVKEPGPDDTWTPPDEDAPPPDGEGGENPPAASDAAAGDAGGDGEFPADTLQRAYDLGMTEAEAKAFGSPGVLEHALSVMESKIIAKAGQEGAGDGRQTQQPRSRGVKVPKLDKEKYDEEVVALATAVEQMAAKLDVIESHASKQKQEAAEKEFVGWLQKLPEEFSDTFGGKAGDVWDPKSEAFKNASSVWDAERALALGMNKLGRKLPPKEDIRRRALNSVYGEKSAVQARKAVESKLAGRRALATVPAQAGKTSANSGKGDVRSVLNRIWQRDGGFESERPEKL